MTRLNHITVIAERYGLTLHEYMAVDVCSIVVMAPKEVDEAIGKILGTTEDPQAVQSCIAKNLLEVSDGMTALTAEGKAVKQAISAELAKLSV
jgi:hypothetical protein